MHGFRRILVGVDLSHADRLAAAELNPPTQEAVRRAVWLAGQLSAELTFFASLDISAHTRELLEERFEETTQNVESEAHAVLDELVQRAKQDGVAAHARLTFGPPWLEITKDVLREGHDLVVVGTRDLGTAGRWLFGSTGMKLLRNCPCPVWVTKPDPNWDDVNMLVASDLEEASQNVLNVAVGGGQLADAKVHVLHALDLTIDRRMFHTGLPEAQVQEFRRKKIAEAEQELHEQLAQTDYRTLTYGVQVHVKEGPPDLVILEAIEEYDIDLLVLGTVARHGIPGVLIGNTCERLLSQVPCSVLAIKPPDFVCPVELD